MYSPAGDTGRTNILFMSADGSSTLAESCGQSTTTAEPCGCSASLCISLGNNDNDKYVKVKYYTSMATNGKCFLSLLSHYDLDIS